MICLTDYLKMTSKEIINQQHSLSCKVKRIIEMVNEEYLNDELENTEFMSDSIVDYVEPTEPNMPFIVVK